MYLLISCLFCGPYCIDPSIAPGYTSASQKTARGEKTGAMFKPGTPHWCPPKDAGSLLCYI